MADHRSAVDAMNRDREQVLRANGTVLSVPNSRAIFIRRRDQLARVLSDLLGQQTGLWGPITPDGRVHPQRDETVEYRSTLANRPIRPVPVDVVEWYLNHVAKLEDHLRTAIDDAARLDLSFEDIMGDGVPLAARLEAYCGVLDFLGFPSAGHYWDITTVRSLLHPSSRLNDAATLGRIPNLADIQSRFGHLFISDRV
ncbi:MAG: hypothetical protein ACKVZ0_05765 [Gemmatimonadales bacterium]